MKSPPIVTILTLAFATSSVGLAANGTNPLMVTHLQCEGLVRPNAIDAASPRFSWRLESDERGVRQTAYQVRVTEVGAGGDPAGSAVESARVGSDQSQWVEITAFKAKPKARYEWRVRVWDNHGHDSGWSEAATFATGLMGGAWTAEWLSDGRDVGPDAAPPARYFRKAFELPQAPLRARLYLSAFGLVEPWLNGRKATEDHFIPGWPDYTKRDLYVAYDVTTLLHAGENAIGLILGDGWFSGTLLRDHQYGPQPEVSAFLEIVDRAGKTTTVATDGTWQWAEGPITANAIYHGETFDARKDDADWSEPAGCAWNWHAVRVCPRPAVELDARLSPPARGIQELNPVSRREVQPGVFVYDLGQNMVGWARLKVQMPAGREIQLRFAEMLSPDGTIYTANLRTARATARYIACGGGVETWEPRFTYFGFRYIELSGVTTPADDAVTGIVVHADLPRIGQFECSNPLLNKLYSNTLWGQKGNFLEVPTDCPQRNERLGWTGDAQVFSNTASYNMACGAFYRQWLWAVRDSFKDGEDGGYGDVAPTTGFNTGSAGWGDAGVIVPWVTWLHTGDRRVLEENFDTMERWVDLQEKQAPDGIRRSRQSYGDWLAPGYEPGKAPTPYVLIATAYLARTTQLAAQIADVLGRPVIAQKNRALLARVKAAFRKEFIADDGKMMSDEQTAYLLAFAFDLVPADLRPKMIKQLLRVVAAKDNHLATGFLGTPLLASVLTEVGRPDLAYAAVEQETYPGWLFSVKNGATTVWERWDSWTPDKGFSSSGMNSFNHYAYGSIVEWLYDTVAGLKPDASAAGWRRFHIAPQPGGGLTHASASVETPYGRAASNWRLDNGRLQVNVVIPPNTEAKMSLPGASAAVVQEGGRPLAQLREATDIQAAAGRVTFRLPSGDYLFSVITQP